MCARLVRILVILTFFIQSLSAAGLVHAAPNTVLGLPAPGTIVELSQPYVPTLIKGLTVHPENPLMFDFLVDTGHSKMQGEELKAEGQKLIKYFLASLTIPEDDFWVNLSPYEKDRIVSEGMGQTDMGRDLLAQDYILKQLTASLIYPEKELGKSFWDKVYSKAQQLYGTSEVPVNTFNKVWIIGDRASVFEQGNTAYVADFHLKVMLEEDYLAMQKNKEGRVMAQSADLAKPQHSVGAEIIREVIVPEIEREVNQGKNFANLRQVFYSLILANWYKNNLKQALLNQVYSDKGKTNGIESNDKTLNEQIYKQYLAAYKKGVFNYIKEDIDRVSQQPVPRKYFSGGVKQGRSVRFPDRAMTADGVTALVGRGFRLLTEAVIAGRSSRVVAFEQLDVGQGSIKVKDGSDDHVLTSEGRQMDFGPEIERWMSERKGSKAWLIYAASQLEALDKNLYYWRRGYGLQGLVDLLDSKPTEALSMKGMEGRETLWEGFLMTVIIRAGYPMDHAMASVMPKDDTSAGQFTERIENPFLLNMRNRLARPEKHMRDMDRTLADELVNNDVSVTGGWLDLPGEREIFTVRVSNNGIMGPRKGGIRYVKASDLIKPAGDEPTPFQLKWQEFLRLNPSKGQVEAFIARWLTQEAKALAIGMTLKTAGIANGLGGAKGAVFIGDIIKTAAGQWTLKDWAPNEYQETLQYLTARAHARYLTLQNAIGINIDSPAPDINTNPELMAVYTDEYIRVLAEQGIQNFQRSSIGRDQYADLYDRLRAVLQETVQRKPNETPFLDIVYAFWQETGWPVPWLGVFTGKDKAKGGVEGRAEATGEGVVEVTKYYYELKGQKYQGKTMAVQGFGNVGSNAAIAAVREGFIVQAINDETGTFFKAQGWTYDELRAMSRRSSKLRVQWERGDIRREGVMATVNNDIEIWTALMGADVDVLVPAAGELQINGNNVHKVRARMIVEGANGPIDPVADKYLREQGVVVLPDTLANSGGVFVSGLEMAQAKSGKRLSRSEVNQRLRDILHKALEDTVKVVEEDARSPLPENIGYRQAFDRVALTNLARERMNGFILKYRGELNLIREEYEPGTTSEIVLKRIERLGLLEEWRYNTMAGLLSTVQAGLAYVFMRQGSSPLAENTEQYIAPFIAWCKGLYEDPATRSKATRMMRTFAKLTREGELLSTAIKRLGYDLAKPADIAKVRGFREELLAELKDNQAKDDVFERAYKDIVVKIPALDDLPKDPAMADAVNGGIDLGSDNLRMDVTRKDGGVKVEFDPAMVEQFKRGDFSGVTPVILDITPIPGLLPVPL